MSFDPKKHRQRSIRLKGYDYSQAGAYFVTICTYQRECLLGDIVDGETILNLLGEIIQNAWNDLPNHYPYVILDEFCVMPNHVHGIILLADVRMDGSSGRSFDGGGSFGRGGSETRPYDETHAHKRRHGLPEIVRAFKSFSSRHINQLQETPGVPVWQRNYYERIVRNHHELEAIRGYIQNNPFQWDHDRENPDVLSADQGIKYE